MKRLERIWVAMAFVCALSLATGFAISAAGQNTAPGKIHGMVADVQGAPLPGISVSFRHTTTSQVFDIVTDNGGRYIRTGLPPGNYTVTLKQKAETIYEQVVVLAPGQDLPLDFNFKELQAKQNADAAQAE